MAPSKSVNRPGTELMTKCFTEKPTVLWTLSILYSSAARAKVESSRATGKTRVNFRMFIEFILFVEISQISILDVSKLLCRKLLFHKLLFKDRKFYGLPNASL